MSKQDKLAETLEAQSAVAAKALAGMVGRMMVEALAGVLGSAMAAAPRDMADRLDASIIGKVRQSRAATWAALDAVRVQ